MHITSYTHFDQGIIKSLICGKFRNKLPGTNYIWVLSASSEIIPGSHNKAYK